MKFVVRPAATADLRRAYLWYEAEREGLGEQGNRITLPPWRRLELEGEKHLPNLREAACS